MKYGLGGKINTTKTRTCTTIPQWGRHGSGEDKCDEGTTGVTRPGRRVRTHQVDFYYQSGRDYDRTWDRDVETRSIKYKCLSQIQESRLRPGPDGPFPSERTVSEHGVVLGRGVVFLSTLPPRI